MTSMVQNLTAKTQRTQRKPTKTCKFLILPNNTLQGHDRNLRGWFIKRPVFGHESHEFSPIYRFSCQFVKSWPILRLDHANSQRTRLFNSESLTARNQAVRKSLVSAISRPGQVAGGGEGSSLSLHQGSEFTYGSPSPSTA